MTSLNWDQSSETGRDPCILDEYVIGQDEAKKALSVAVYNHYKRILASKNSGCRAAEEQYPDAWPNRFR